MGDLDLSKKIFTKKYVDEALASSSASIDIAVQSAQPFGQNVGDFWYQIT